MYTSDTKHLYGVYQNLLNIVALRRLNGTMAEYSSKVHALLHDFNDLLPLASALSLELEQRSKFSMYLALHGLPDEHSHVRDQILESHIVLRFTLTCSILFRVLSKPTTNILASIDDSSVLVSQHDDRNCPHKPSKERHKCEDCHKLGHRIDMCYALHGHPPQSAAVSKLLIHNCLLWVILHLIPQDNLLFPMNFSKWYKDRQKSSSTVCIAHTGTSFVGLTHSNPLGP